MRVLTTDLTLTTPRGRDRFGLRTDPDGLGRFAERIAALLGTGRFLAAQTALVLAWMAWNRLGPAPWRFDTRTFIVLNLVISLQAAYAAPLILLAESRQAEADRRQQEEDRRRAAAITADLGYLARELAALRVRMLDADDLAALEARLRAVVDAGHAPPASPTVTPPADPRPRGHLGAP